MFKKKWLLLFLILIFPITIIRGQDPILPWMKIGKLTAKKIFGCDTLAVRGLRIGGTYSMPQNNGSADQVLTTDGAGGVTWQSFTGAGAGGWTDDDTVVRLTTSSDKVAIGTTSTTFALEVQGKVQIDSALNLCGNPIIDEYLKIYKTKPSLHFDGTGDYFEIPNSIMKTLDNNYTVEFIGVIDSIRSSTQQFIMHALTWHGISWQIQSTGTMLIWQERDGANFSYSFTNPIVLHKPTIFNIIFNRFEGWAQLWMNGERIWTHSLDQTDDFVNTTNVLVGYSGSYAVPFMNMSFLRIYNCALDSTEILKSYQMEDTPFSMTGADTGIVASYDTSGTDDLVAVEDLKKYDFEIGNADSIAYWNMGAWAASIAQGDASFIVHQYDSVKVYGDCTGSTLIHTGAILKLDGDMIDAANNLWANSTKIGGAYTFYNATITNPVRALHINALNANADEKLLTISLDSDEKFWVDEDGDVRSDGDIAADSFTEFCHIYTKGDALQKLQMFTEPGLKPDDFGFSRPDKSRIYKGILRKFSTRIDSTTTKIEYGIDLGKRVALLQKAILLLLDRIQKLENK